MTIRKNGLLLLCLTINVLCFSQSLPDKIRSYTTVRITTPSPVIDGILNDPCWKSGKWDGDFVQWIPKEGAAPSSPTFIKVLYDNKNIYVAIRSVDREPGKMSQKTGRRDEMAGDVVGICFDSYHDHRTGFEFDLCSSGQKIDQILTNPMTGDLNWNAVWTGKTSLEDSAWVAEFEIPLSQLRYSNENTQTWGMHCWRWIDRLQEESDWEPQSSTSPGMLYLFGHLNGISNLPKSRRIEIMPYLLGKANTFEKQAGNPFTNDGNKWFGTCGIDTKIGLSSNFTANVAINPDFGQVEADPSVMNLTAFETFYEEKRPFFLEGINIFDYKSDDANLFYSRRIGHSPTYMPPLASGEFIDYPENTSILSAVKISGKTANGLSVGLLNSLTNNEHARLFTGGETHNTSVEPLTSYSLVRLQQDFNKGATTMGGILSVVNRFLNENKFDFLNRNAMTGGLDLLHQWHDKEFFVEARLMGSFIQGDKQAIALLQQSPAHYFQRPGSGYLTYDPNRNELSGHGGRLRIGKGSKGLWRYSAGMNWRSPGLDLNDLGFMRRADVVNIQNELSYFVNKPVSIFRTYRIGIKQNCNWDFGGNYLFAQWTLDSNFEFLNKWKFTPIWSFTGEALDNQILRGGYAMKVPSFSKLSATMNSDGSRRLAFSLTYENLTASSGSATSNSLSPQITYRPVNALKFIIGASYTANNDQLQYIGNPTTDGQARYLLGTIHQKTLGATFRVDYNLTPELSIQYYGSPFASVGHYSAFRSVTNPLADQYRNRTEQLAFVRQEANVVLKEHSGQSYSIANPDFSFAQFRSNMVLRWEYRPGSQLFVVWSNERTRSSNLSGDNLHNAFSGLQKIFQNNLFLIKLSYWFSI